MRERRRRFLFAIKQANEMVSLSFTKVTAKEKEATSRPLCKATQLRVLFIRVEFYEFAT